MVNKLLTSHEQVPTVVIIGYSGLRVYGLGCRREVNKCLSESPGAHCSVSVGLVGWVVGFAQSFSCQLLV